MDSIIGRRTKDGAGASIPTTTHTIELADLKPLPAEATLDNDIRLANTSTTTTVVTIPINNNLNAEEADIEKIEVTEKETAQNGVDMEMGKILMSTPQPHAQAQENVDEIITTNSENTTTISIIPALPSTSTQRQLFKEAAAIHGGDAATEFLQHELNSALMSAQQHQQQLQAQKQQRIRTTSSTLDANISRNPSAAGKHEKKIGHRRVDEGGEVTYKKIQSKQIMGSIQLGIQYTVSSLASKPKRDLLMNDFWEMETISFPADGSTITPAHHYNDFRFKVYAPIAFRYFRDLFGIAPDDFLMSLCASPLRQLSNPGASGSIFYLTDDDEFIIKTVQKKECEFLQKLLPGYYMNLSQNPRTLLPKFFGLYCFNYNAKNVRLVTMNNLLPSDIKMHAKYDLKGSTFRRKASKVERQKASPTFKDLDFMEHHPNGIFLETDKYNALIKTIQRDCMVLESFQIMDYSLLVGIHNLDIAAKEKREERIRNARAKLQRTDEIREGNDDAPETDQSQIIVYNPVQSAHPPQTAQAAGTALNRTRSINRQRLVAHSTAMESITADIDAPLEGDEDVPAGGIPARSENDERLILYIGIIDILQSYRLEKKLEHTFKSIIYNGDTVSVCRPSFYAQRFQNFMGKTVFKKTPTFPLKHSPSKRKTSTATTVTSTSIRTPQRTPSQSISSPSMRPFTHLSGMSTPPPAFDDISEEDITATSSTAFARSFNVSSKFMQQRSYLSSNRSVLSSATDDYSDDELMASSSVALSPKQKFFNVNTPATTAAERPLSPKLTKTNVQLATIGCNEDDENEQHSHLQQHQLQESQQEQQQLPQNIKVEQQVHGENNIEVDRDQQLAVDSTVSNLEHTLQKTNIDEHIDANGKPVISTTKTTIINNTTQTYTSTLVLNDVHR